MTNSYNHQDSGLDSDPKLLNLYMWTLGAGGDMLTTNRSYPQFT